MTNTCFGNSFNVTEFGASPNNGLENDDGVSIQKAINAAKTFSEANSNAITEVFFPLGTYYIRNPGTGSGNQNPFVYGLYLYGEHNRGLVIPSNIVIRFEKGSVIHKEYNENYEVFYLENVENVTFINTTIKHATTNQISWVNSRHGIYIKGSKYINIIGCNFENIPGKAILINNNSIMSEGINISNSSFTTIKGEAIVVGPNVQNVTIVNNRISDTGGDGILIKGNACTVIENILENIGNGGEPGSGIALGTDNAYTENNIIDSNIVINTYFFGIINDGSQNTIISNNILINPSILGNGSAIKIGGRATYSIVTQNTIKNVRINSITRGIIVLDGYNCQITYNAVLNHNSTLISGQFFNDERNKIFGNKY